jgi:hypothetical protein
MLNKDAAQGIAHDGSIADAASLPAGVARWPAFAPGLLLAMVILGAVYGPAAARLDFLEPDNAMRLVGVRDFLNGQPWFDLTQSRLGLGEGVEMHWARWIDALIALPILLLSPIVGDRVAEVITAFLWPFSLLAAFMALLSGICMELAPAPHKRQAAIIGPILAALAFPVMDRFGPGALDHHGVVLVLLSLALLMLLRMERSPWLGAAAGFALAGAMGAAAEALPFVAAGVVGAGLAWTLAPEQHGRGLVRMGLGLAVGAGFFFLVQVSPDRWSADVCDAMSPAYLGFGVLAGAGAILLGAMSGRLSGAGFAGRLGAASILGAVGGAAFVALYPECRGGGYGAVSADFRALWMAQIAEARSIVRLAQDDIALLFGLCGSAAFGLAALAWALRRDLHAPGVWMAASLVLTAWVLMIWQVRGSTLASAFVLPFATLLVVHLRAAHRAAPTPRSLIAFVGAGALSCSAIWSGVGVQVRALTTPPASMAAFKAATTDALACFSSSAYSGLAALEPGRMVNPFALGPAVLLSTPHSVVAGPYHRNQAGTMAAISIYRSDAEAASAEAARIGARYVLACPGTPEFDFYSEHALPGVAPGDTLAARLGADTPPSWLRRVDDGTGPLRVYVVAGSGAG